MVPGSFGIVRILQRPVVVGAVAAVVLAAGVGLAFALRPAPEPPVDSARLRDAVTQEALVAHLEALQQVADDHGGNRAAGTPGYAASVEYVQDRLEEAGYRTTRQQFSYERPDFTRATLRRTAPAATTYVVGRDHRPLAFSGSGATSARLTAVDVNLEAPGETTSGCEAADFAGFPRGDIALVQRGTCQFAVKVDHAVAAGATAVVVFNQGDDPGRTGLFAGTLGRQAAVPVLATSFELGAEWARTAGTTLMLAVDSTVARVTSENLIAETAAGSPGRTLVVGAHLDGVAEGPGVNDNASGVAAVLETALQFAELRVAPANRVRFAFWGGEEDGLFGSAHYVAQLDAAARSGTAAYLNLDMIASPNPVAAVYSGGGGPGAGWPAGSARLQAVLADFLTAQGVAPQTVSFRSSDHASFLEAGIPVGGLFTGADEATDPCYHQACDRVATVDREMLHLMADTAAHATLTLANSPD